MIVHGLKWFKKNCRLEADGYYYYYKGKRRDGYMPLIGIDLCGRKVEKEDNRYKVHGGTKIDNTIVFEFTYMPLWFFEKEGMEIE